MTWTRYLPPLLMLCAVCCASTAFAKPGKCSIVPEAIESASEIRGLRVKRSVKCKLVDKSFVENYLRTVIKEKIPAQRIDGEGVVYKMLGLIPPNYDYVNGLVELYTSQLGGYYDPEQGYYAMASWLPSSMQMGIAVHELTHALQDQHFSLDDLLDHQAADSDELMARSALVEGDATAVMVDYSRKQGGQASIAQEESVAGIMMQSLAGSLVSGSGSESPAALRTLMMFPYVSGLNFAHALLKKRGYKSLDGAFTKLPQSTEQILHPDVYLSGSRGFRELEAPLPERAVLDSTQAVFSDRFGEFFISTLLGNWISPGQASKAASGWGGDRLALYRTGTNREILVWVTAWDSKSEANEFYESIAEAYRKRFNQNGLTSGRKLVFAETDFGRVEIEQNEAEVQITIGL
ncbi:MAG: hypothetical protein KDD66_00350 [Bdellovibrionales bacterium]|nr:hypothetical protein [Bdellovibrionales bacterium]